MMDSLEDELKKKESESLDIFSDRKNLHIGLFDNLNKGDIIIASNYEGAHAFDLENEVVKLSDKRALSVSPDGRLLLLRKEENHRNNYYVLDLELNNERPVFSTEHFNKDFSQAVFSYDSNSIYFIERHDFSNQRCVLKKYNLKTEESEDLIDILDQNTSFSFSRDLKNVMINVALDKFQKVDPKFKGLYKASMLLDLTTLKGETLGVDIYNPQWVNQEVVIGHNSYYSNGALIYDIERGKIKDLPKTYYAFSISPDGNHVVFYNEEGGGLFLTDTEFKDIKTIMKEVSAGRFGRPHATWTPDSEKILFNNGKFMENNVYVYNFEEGNLKKTKSDGENPIYWG